MKSRVSAKACAIAALGSAIQAFGLYNIHSISGVTEGGILGLTLLLHHWFGISPALSSLVLNAACYILGAAVLGRSFVIMSVVAGGSFSAFYWLFEHFPPLWPGIADMPLLAALVGALFIGVGVGLGVRMGGASGGDDALAMSLSHVTHIKIQWIYLLSDFAVLVLSLSYIPLNRMVYSILTVLLSGQIIGFVQTAGTHPVENMET